jgi:hypothetical protein
VLSRSRCVYPLHQFTNHLQLSPQLEYRSRLLLLYEVNGRLKDTEQQKVWDVVRRGACGILGDLDVELEIVE